MVTYYIKKRETDEFYCPDNVNPFKITKRTSAYFTLSILKATNKHTYKKYEVYFKLTNH